MAKPLSQTISTIIIIGFEGHVNGFFANFTAKRGVRLFLRGRSERTAKTGDAVRTKKEETA